ncbi:Serpin (serine protease inhibitor) [Popillia japonica]|uniref:Serpin (Serine protease inhibitor) n=1 Tax=Popillia japonica TaxID=7064 RepID=A0AAW1KL11_POPJA
MIAWSSILVLCDLLRVNTGPILLQIVYTYEQITDLKTGKCSRPVYIGCCASFPFLSRSLNLPKPTMAEKALSQVCSGNSTFSNKLYEILCRKEGNVFYSPLSAHAILSLVHQGAAGETAASMGKSLHLSDSKLAAEGYQSLMETLNAVDNVTLHIANKVFVHHERKLKGDFDAIAKKHYLAETENIQFSPDSAAAANKINGWVENKTNNKIKDLIQPNDLNDDTRLVLVNAIYFKGDWLEQFKPQLTKKEKFYLNETDTVECDMMHMNKKFLYGEDNDLDAQILSLPYKNQDLSLMIILPKSKTGIGALEKKLVTKDLSALSRSLHKVEVILSLPKFKIETTIELNDPLKEVSHKVEVILSLPKFKIETTIELNDPLKELGMGVIFSENANFPNMLEGGEPLQVSKVIQKAFIEVNEEGAEAAAATGIMIELCCLEEDYLFKADHPFAFYLCYHLGESTVPLFSGILKTFS